LAKVDVDACVKANFSDLVTNAGVSALWVLLIGHAMEKKHVALQEKYKDASEDVEIWKHKATGLEGRLKDALADKKVAKKAVTDLKVEKEVVELERDSWKEKAAGLESDIVKAQAAMEEGKGDLSLYFDNGFERARARMSFILTPDGKFVNEN
jgi:DNA repair exonuclease SbcCD ATPase subunit